MTLKEEMINYTNNKLIAEFMGYPRMTDAVDDRTIAYDIGESIMNVDNTNNENEDNVFHPDDMQFRASWDWLMPVVVKCFDVFDQTNLTDDLNFKLNDALLETNIDSLYKAVVEFIKQYKHNNLKNTEAMTLKEAMMNAHEMSASEANAEIKRMQSMVMGGSNPEDLLYEWGLEPDYVIDLLF